MLGKGDGPLQPGWGRRHSPVRCVACASRERRKNHRPPMRPMRPGGWRVGRPDFQQEVVRLRKEQGLSWRAIAAQFGCNRKTVCRAFERATASNRPAVGETTTKDND